VLARFHRNKDKTCRGERKEQNSVCCSSRREEAV
jgi:hypothetical protein